MKAISVYQSRCATSLLTFVLVYNASLLMFGCGKRMEDSNLNSNHAPPSLLLGSVTSTADVANIILPGMSTNHVVARFGSPGSTRQLANGASEWRYAVTPFPAGEEITGTYVFGIRLAITNGRIAELSYDYIAGTARSGAQTELPFQSSSHLNAQSTVTLKFFLLSKTPLPGGRYINTKALPELGYIADSAIFETRQVKSVALEQGLFHSPENTPRPDWSFTVHLVKDDALRLNLATQTNVFETVVITIDEEPIAVAVLRAPLEGGSFVFECRDRSLMEVAKNRLTRLKRVDQ